MALSPGLLLVTGATGLVGSHVCEQARRRGWNVLALVRPASDAAFLRSIGVEVVPGDLDDPASLPAAVQGVTHVVHCAARVGDWGPADEYLRANVGGLENLLAAFLAAGLKPHVIQISSLGVYPAGEHHGTDETMPVSVAGIDGYTRSKVAAEELLAARAAAGDLTCVMLRPGFLYGPRDRTVVPRLLARVRSGKFAFLGSGEKLVSNTYVGNLVDAVFLALDRPDLSGEAFNVTDGRLVTKKEFVAGVCAAAGLPCPTKHVPLGLVKVLAGILEPAWRLLGKTTSPPVSQAAIKFMGYNLDFRIDKARTVLGYAPAVDFQEAIRGSV